MKAILGNFTKISETEFRLKKDLQFADITVKEDGKIDTVNYQDKQNIQIGDILTHQDIDYEILDINADQIKYISVKVKSNIQEQDISEKPKFIARKMTHRKPKTTPRVVKQQLVKKEVIKEEKITPIVRKKAVPTTPIPNKPNIFKRLLRWIGNKLTSYSDS